MSICRAEHAADFPIPDAGGLIGNTFLSLTLQLLVCQRIFARSSSATCVHDPRCRGSLVTKAEIPIHKGKKTYQKPELKTINAQAVIEKLRPLALAGDKAAQQIIQLISHKHDIR